MTKKSDFKTGDFVVYPTHGVGLIKGTETQIVAGTELDLLVIDFEQDRMTLRIPVGKARTSGLRRIHDGRRKTVRNKSVSSLVPRFAGTGPGMTKGPDSERKDGTTKAGPLVAEGRRRKAGARYIPMQQR